tara:strand:- start:6326 stop:6754 length:429 start_codon:yes stop_codon:yes gene_type:complete
MANFKNFKKSWEMEVGINNVASYQVSGRPFVSGGINCNSVTPTVIKFPYVTRWITVVNNDISREVKVGFSKAGIQGNNFFTVPELGGAPGLLATSHQLELKVSEIWISGSTNVDVLAGLTTIPATRTTTTKGPSWSGSSGVG